MVLSKSAEMSCYLDYQSAKPVDPRVLETMTPYFTENFGNPSSLHSVGDEATDALENSRRAVAGLIHADKDEIIFTSGATESSNLALIGFAQRNRRKGDHIVISEVEHISIHNLAKQLEKLGFSVSKIPVTPYGEITMEKLRQRIGYSTILVSVQTANNEIGTIQPIAEIGKFCRERDIAFHTDAVAAEGLLPLDVGRDPVDLMTLSSNDIYGPKGLGALYVRKGVKISPHIIGGGQEFGIRSGSENMPGIIGMAKAAEIMREEMPEEVKRLRRYRDRLIKSILKDIPRSHLNGHQEKRLANNVNVRFEGIEGESLLLSLKDRGISVATGSACSSKTLEPSHTLISLGLLHEEAHGSLEMTMGRFTRDQDIERVLSVLPEIVARLRSLSPLYKEEN